MLTGSREEKWPRLLIAVLLVSVFFEGSGYSFSLLGARIRSVQVFEVLFLGILMTLALFGKWRCRKSPFDLWLLAFLAVNFIAIFNSSWKARSLKIFLLLVSLALLYWLLYQLLRTANDMSFAFTVFLVAGTAQVLFGLYQVLAGALNHYEKWRLPIGHLGLVHREYINSVWGRPYGTQVEPDFYGAFCMVFALIFIILLFAKGGKIKKWLWAGAVLSLLGLFFSFVRMAWLIFFLLLPLLALARKKLPFFRFTWMAAALIASVTVGASVFAAVVVPPIRQICETRFATKVPASSNKRSAWRFNSSLLNTQNVRLTLIQLSLHAWREHPFFGNGPGSFPFTYFRATVGDAGVRRKIAENAFRQTNPSMLFTVLEDSGLFGLFLFLVLAAKFVFLSYKKLTGLSTPLAPQTFALAIALAALLLSYMLTNGLWLPFTWVLLALAAAHLREFPLRNEGPVGPSGGPCA